jgi:hypothetical protein
LEYPPQKCIPASKGTEVINEEKVSCQMNERSYQTKAPGLDTRYITLHTPELKLRGARATNKVLKKYLEHAQDKLVW